MINAEYLIPPYGQNNRQTDTCENITFPQLLLQKVKYTIQAWIPVGCVPTTAVAATRCQYGGLCPEVGVSVQLVSLSGGVSLPLPQWTDGRFWKHYLPLRSVINSSRYFVLILTTVVDLVGLLNHSCLAAFTMFYKWSQIVRVWQRLERVTSACEEK